jgi:hypothetical protein
MTVIDWLLDSDPSIRWQAMRDLMGAPADEVTAERARVATRAWEFGCLHCRGLSAEFHHVFFRHARACGRTLRISPLTAKRLEGYESIAGKQVFCPYSAVAGFAQLAY